MMKQSVFGKYRIASPLKQTQTSTIYLARQLTATEWGSALHLFHAASFATMEAREAFLQDVEPLLHLRHPGIVATLDAGIEQERPYLVTEYAGHDTLRRRLKQRLPDGDALAISVALGQALQYAHDKGICHGHIQPENIFFTGQNLPRLAYFHIGSGLTEPEGITEKYTAPEGGISQKGDQYALACLSYELFSGHLPASALERVDASARISFHNLIADPALPATVEAVLRQALAYHPGERYPDIATFIEALTNAVGTNTAYTPGQTTNMQKIYSSENGQIAGLYSRAAHNGQQKRFQRYRPGKRLFASIVACLVIITTIFVFHIFQPTPSPDLRVFRPVATKTATALIRQTTPAATVTIVSATSPATISVRTATATAQLPTPTPTPQPTPTITPITQPQATPTPMATATPTPTPSPVTAPTPSLRMSVQTTPSAIDLTAQGTGDWMHWGLNDAYSVDRKQGANIINFQVVSDDVLRNYGDNPSGYSWSNGNPTTQAQNTHTGIFIAGEGEGFRITVPADTTTHVLRVYVGIYQGQGTFSANLSDGTSPQSSNDTISSHNANTASIYVYTITYRARAAGQQLTISYLLLGKYDPEGNVNIQAATLQ